MFSYHQPLGRLARWPLKAIPKKMVMPILSGRNRGLWWISGSFVHGCWLGWYEKPCVEFVATLIRPGMVAFDVGANVGFYTLLLAQGVGPEGRVIAFEPDPANVAYLKKHLSLNKIDNVEIVEAAVSDKEGTAYFSGTGAMGKLSHAGAPIQSVQLDNFSRPDFIKMDIEGGETAALRGSAKILAERHAVWFIALHGLACAETPRLLTSQNYTLDWVTTDEICARAV